MAPIEERITGLGWLLGELVMVMVRKELLGLGLGWGSGRSGRRCAELVHEGGGGVRLGLLGLRLGLWLRLLEIERGLEAGWTPALG